MSTEAHGCVYVSETTGVHDKRWLSALDLIGMRPIHIAQDRYATESDFLQDIERVSRGIIPIVAGPLSIAETLVPRLRNVVFLSWGFDLQEAPTSLDLSQFVGAIVDSSANQRIAQAAGIERIALIPWGVNIGAIDSNAEVADLTSYGIRADHRVVLSLRAHEPRYRVADIIEALADGPHDVQLVVGNSGSLTSELRALSDRLGAGAVFLPPVNETDVIPLMRRASAYVTASEVDGTSVTLLQAMACQVPVAVSANTGNVDWIDDGVTGYMFPIGDVRELRNSVTRALAAGVEVTGSARALIEARADWRHNINMLHSLLTKR